MSEAFPVWAREHAAAETAPAASSAPGAPAAAPAPQPAPADERPRPEDATDATDAADATGTAAEPRPLGVTVAMTGNADVDAAVERLGDADEMPVRDHIEVYEDVHLGLRNALAALDENRG
jgi:hypothetical protein